MTRPPKRRRARRPAAFLDRDGTINVERSFISEPAQLELLPGVMTALRRLHDAGYALVVVTNQSGIARGLYDERTLASIHRLLHEWLDELPDAYLHCPHHPDLDGPYGGPCRCRKPATGMIEDAAKLLDLDLDRSIVIGDSARDLHGAHRLGLRSVLVRSGKPWREQLARLVDAGVTPDHTADDLPAAVDWVLLAEQA